MAKTLNISKLAKQERSIAIGDDKFKVREMNVQDFIELTSTAERLKAENAPFHVQLEENIKSILKMTDMPEALLREMTLDELAVISSFVRGVDVGDVVETPSEAEGELKK